jgi:chromosome partitioning protein
MSKTTGALATVPKPQRKILIVSSPKGGVGKTFLSRNIAVAAAMAGLRVATVDLDKQRSLTKWYGRRPNDLAPINHFDAEITDSAEIIRGLDDFDLAVIDTPTAVEEYPADLERVLDAATYVLVPCQASKDDTESVVPWMEYLKSRNRPAAFVLNRIRRNTASMRNAKFALNRAGRLCPVEMPQAEDVVRAAEIGAGILEIKGALSAGEFQAVWEFVRSEMEL